MARMAGPSTTIVTITCAVLTIMRIAVASATGTTMNVGCQIRAIPYNDMLRLEAVAVGPRPATGNYQFEVFKQSSSGTSQNVQSGEFELDAGRDTILTTVILEGAARGRYRARLTLDSQEFGRISCVSP
jgi:hypothetical protein